MFASSDLCVAALLAVSCLSGHGAAQAAPIAPKFVIISMFQPEAAVWHGIPDFNLLAQNITLPGLSPLFPAVHCTANNDICQVITGESEINAASTITAFALSPRFNLTQSYFMIGGIGGIRPDRGTISDVTFARYAIQVALQYELDIRDVPANYSTGYVPLGSSSPSEYPQQIYGTEVFELNTALRSRAVSFARKAQLNDSARAMEYRAQYSQAAAMSAPSVRECDAATSDVYYYGPHLSDAFDNTTRLFTNGSGVYCTTAEEDNATLEALMRAAYAKLLDFGRIILMRTASDFESPPPGQSAVQNLFFTDQGAFESAVTNIYLAGKEVISGIVGNWAEFKDGVKADNYIGDIFGTLGGTPDFGQPSQFLNNVGRGGIARRGLHRGAMRR